MPQYFIIIWYCSKVCCLSSHSWYKCDCFSLVNKFQLALNLISKHGSTAKSAIKAPIASTNQGCCVPRATAETDCMSSLLTHSSCRRTAKCLFPGPIKVDVTVLLWHVLLPQKRKKSPLQGCEFFDWELLYLHKCIPHITIPVAVQTVLLLLHSVFKYLTQTVFPSVCILMPYRCPTKLHVSQFQQNHVTRVL